MSEEKLYVVKNDEGKYWDIAKYMPPWWNDKTGTAFKRIDVALAWAKNYGAHVVTLIEEPEKVVLTEEQAKIVENTRDIEFPANYISARTFSSDDEKLIMEAYVNGYTVENEKKYNVKVPKEWCGDDKHYWTKEQDGALTWAWLIDKDYMIPTQQFTLTEIEHYGLQDCEKEEVTDDETRD